MLPWITDAATEYLDNIIGTKRAAGEEIHALECGAGSSTGYLAQRVTHLVSLDHDESWHQAIRAAVTAIGCANVEWRRHDRPYFTLLDDYPEATFFHDLRISVVTARRLNS
jgi:trans-aconitate methyltransferase